MSMEEKQDNNTTASQVASVVNLPGYEIKDVLGKGGMAVVYLAIQESIGRQVALKILVPDHTDDTFTDRFLREARIISNLAHPNIITVYDAGVHQGSHYMSMEYIPGHSLRESRDELTRQQKIVVVKQIAQALDYAGKKGYVHRDIKPENILLHEDGRAILTDFGIARSQHATQGLTMTGKVIGTPYYMSPEQAKGIEVDHRSDVYSLGVVLFQALTGHLPYDGPSLVAIGIKHISEPIPELPVGLERFQPIINTCLSKDPEHRFQTAEDLYQALDAIPESELDFLDAKANAKRKSTNTAGKNYAAKTIASELPSGQTIPPAPTLQPDQIRTAHISNSRSGKLKNTDPSDEFDQVDDFYITGTDDYRRLKRRKRLVWLLVIAALAIGTGYYRQNDVQHIWTKYLEPAFENAKKVITEQTSTQPDPVKDKTTVVETTEVTSTNLAATKPVDLSTPLNEQPENIKQVTLAYRKIIDAKPNDQRATKGLQEITNWYLLQSRVALQQNDLAKARLLIEQANDTLPKDLLHTEFTRLEKKLLHQETIQEHLQRAGFYMKQDALVVPAGKNALDELQAVLKLEPAHIKAIELIQEIANRYYETAKSQFNANELDKSLQSSELGLTAQKQHKQLLALKSKINKELNLRKQITEILNQAEKQFQAGNIIEPKGQSAVDLYRSVLAKKEKHPAALSGLRQAEDHIAKQISTTIWENRISLAEKYLQKALIYFPNSKPLDQASRKLQIAKAKSAPRITHILLSQFPISSLLKEQEVLQTTPSLSVGFSYTNLSKETTILNFKLDSVTEQLNLVNKKLIVSEKNGEHIFSVKHPLATFLPGQYRITIMLDNKTLLIHNFAISNQPATKVQLR